MKYTESTFKLLFWKLKQPEIIKHFEALSCREKIIFLRNTEELDFRKVYGLFKQKFSSDIEKISATRIVPGPVFKRPSYGTDKYKELKTAGENLIKSGRMAVFLVAGGQGTRLGFAGPKGTFPISPVKKKTLFRIFAEKIKALNIKYSVSVPLIIMTGRENSEQTEKYFKKNGYFGLKRGDVIFCCQKMLPSITPEGKFVLRDHLNICVNPNGHGAAYETLRYPRVKKFLSKRGITDLFYFHVDNPLVDILDPVFAGYHALEHSEFSLKVVRRNECTEKIGVFLNLKGKSRVIEYLEFNSGDLCRSGDFWAGSIGIHIISMDLVRRMHRNGENILPYHRSVKKIKTFDGKYIDIIKFEFFVFDGLKYTNKTAAMEIKRAEEFAPLKNKKGPDSPSRVSSAMNGLYKNWLLYNGIKVCRGVKIEINPFFALSKEDLTGQRNSIPAIIKKDFYIG